ncbi:HD domain-containing protein [bacterium]|nr:MAG: HD domain-containing protein [bacterium]
MSETGRDINTKDLINSLAVSIKTAQIHHVDNVAVIDIINKFLSLINPFLSEQEVTIELVGEFFHVNQNRVRYSMDTIFNYDFLTKEFKKQELGTIIFDDTLKENDMKTLLTAFASTTVPQNPFERLSQNLEGIGNVHIKKLKHIKEETSDVDRKEIIKKSYFNAVSLTKNISKKLSSGEKVSLKRAKRVMETIANLVIEEESMLIGMTTIKDYDEYTYNHSVNVGILSVALGHRIGLPRKHLADLGIAALLHDVGKIEVPKDILNKPSEFTNDDWKIIMQHPVWGAHAVFRLKGMDTSSMSAFIASFEHHLHIDLSGYPKIKSGFKMSLFSKIISIADQYDAMTSARVYARVPTPPDKALSLMIDRSGSQLDAHLMKVFTTMVGVYPLGTLVMLNTSELALVFENNSNQEFIHRPRVYIIVDSKGRKTKQMADLMEKDTEGNFKRTIVKTLDPNQYKINLAEYLL